MFLESLQNISRTQLHKDSETNDVRNLHHQSFAFRDFAIPTIVAAYGYRITKLWYSLVEEFASVQNISEKSCN
jgi:hypothetical protein